MNIYDARAILKALERAGINARIIEHPQDRAEVCLLGIIAYNMDEVMEVVREHYPDDPESCERLLSEIESSSTIDQSV